MGLNRILLGTTAMGLAFLLSGVGFKENRVAHQEKIPTCSDVVQIFSWGQKNHGLVRSQSFDSDVAKRVARLFSEKLDPNFILFTGSEVQELIEQATKKWKLLIQEKNCGVFRSWFQQYFEPAKTRLYLKTATWLKSKSWPKEKKHLKAVSVKYRTFSHDLGELGQRQERFLEANVLAREQSVAYREYLNDILFPMPIDSQTTLAKAMLGALDPYSTYFSETEFSDFYEELSGKTAGIGITVEKSPKGLRIVEVAPKSPAEKAAIKSGDQILEVDGTNLAKLSFRDCAQLLKGEDQTEILLTVENENGKADKNLKRTTQVFEDKKVTTMKVETRAGKKMALVSIPSFYGRGGLGAENSEEKSSSEDLRAELDKLQEKEPLDALILDLRGNPGGYLEEAIAMAGFFLGPKPVVGVKDRKEIRTLKAEGVSDPIYTGPLIVWVDGETASAGEVLAAALKDYQRAVLVGSSSTFGKGSVQKLIRLNDPFLDLKLESGTGVIKLTTSLFFSPLGHSPANRGVRTHISLENDSNASEKKETSKPAMKVEDVSPILGESEVEELHKNESDFKTIIESIKAQDSNEHPAEMASVFEIANQVIRIKAF